jgi:hypothetical protein
MVAFALIPSLQRAERWRRAMMGRRSVDQRALFYEFDLDAVVPKGHLLRRILS